MTLAAGAPPIVAFESPFVFLHNIVHLDALERQLGSASGIAFVTQSSPGRAPIIFEQRMQHPPLTLPYATRALGAGARPAGLADNAAPPATTTNVDTTTGDAQTIDAEPARTAAVDRDVAAAAEVAQHVTFSTGQAPRAHFGVGTPIVPPRTPALAFTYNTIVATPATLGGGSAPSAAAGGAGTTSGGASSGNVQIPGGSVAAPPVTLTGRGELPGVRR